MGSERGRVRVSTVAVGPLLRDTALTSISVSMADSDIPSL
jgi:hypothetical protein